MPRLPGPHRPVVCPAVRLPRPVTEAYGGTSEGKLDALLVQPLLLDSPTVVPFDASLLVDEDVAAAVEVDDDLV